MRLLVYNMRYGTGAGKRFHLPVPFGGYLKHTDENLEIITAFVKSYQPDIVGLLEVDSGSFRARKLNQESVIAEALGHYHIYESKYGSSSVIQRLPIVNKQVNAFLTSEEIKTQKFHFFRKGVKRLVIELELDDLTIFLVHLSIKFRHRQNQLHNLYQLVKDVRKPLIVAGDFNPLWGDDEIQLFLAASGLANANRRSLPSHPSRAPRRQIDFILHIPEIRVTRFEMPPVTFSDHLPLICDFEITRPASLSSTILDYGNVRR
jgi:endonuclease/exonuclease/phosphatase family metal-dependent hydrolase